MTPREIELHHALADSETARCRLVRVARAQVLLLEDGLAALRDGRPHITDEYLERAIAALRQP